MKKTLMLLTMLLSLHPLLAQDYLDSLRVLAEAGDAKSQMELAAEYLHADEPDEKLAFHWLQKAADQNDPEAWYSLAFFYDNGIYVEQDTVKSRECVKTAADLGYVKALNWMAIDILNNDTTQENWPQAVEYLKLSAQRHDGRAFYLLGYLHENGIAVVKSLKEAHQYYRQAVHLGYEDAWSAISSLYVTRIGALKDYLNKDIAPSKTKERKNNKHL